MSRWAIASERGVPISESIGRSWLFLRIVAHFMGRWNNPNGCRYLVVRVPEREGIYILDSPRQDR